MDKRISRMAAGTTCGSSGLAFHMAAIRASGGFMDYIALVVLLFVTAMCERQYLSGDVEPVSEPYPYAPSPYWQATTPTARSRRRNSPTSPAITPRASSSTPTNSLSPTRAPSARKSSPPRGPRIFRKPWSG